MSDCRSLAIVSLLGAFLSVVFRSGCPPSCTHIIIIIIIDNPGEGQKKHSEWWPQKKGICSQSFSGAQSAPPDDTHSSKV
ncbi:hypothetical protein EYF80_050160 [Liparis tanakae]|uniref:Secreted protein n=1 Tax=Liparis tanakae TaxID=230148 RepID=A0A4Z2FFZ8_9TELE|nr:hypothetical protein EYF80_050160 [Liparis tanakae]